MKIGLALGGGGARGLCHIELLKVFDEFQIKPSIISGTSIGSIIGAFYCSGVDSAQMIKLLNEMNLLKMRKMFDFNIFGDSSLIKGKGISEFFEENIKATTFDDLKIPLKISTTDFWKMKEIVFDKGNLVPAIRASMSIPGLFDPVTFQKAILIDGGAVNPVPFDLISNECDFLIAVDISGEKKPKKDKLKPSIFDSVMGMFQIMEKELVMQKLKSSNVDLLLKPKLTNIGVMDFHKHKEIMGSVEKEKELLRHTLMEIV